MTSEKTGENDLGAGTHRPLADLCGEPMEPGGFLILAIAISAALAELHARNLTHENLNPYTILLDEATGTAILPPVTPQPAPAYMSPEQTGRLNLPVDERSDLYSLGVTFYQMLSAALPCVADDLLEWVHCHIAHAPRPLMESAPAIPAPLAAIVHKLLAKNPQERYQTAAGLKWDLERALAQWKESGAIRPFRLGERDLRDRLLIPQKLYGRDKELGILVEAYRSVVESGRPELLMVAGYSGIGKSSLVRALHQPVVLNRGYFISGKFDQYRRNFPYSTIAEALRELIRHILSESEERIARWKREIQAAVGINGQLLVDIVPELELVIGRQPRVPDLPPAEAENRFKLFFRRFVSVFARQEHPLVVFLDDLQWPDPGSLKLLEDLITQDEPRHLLLIGAYRDNEVDPPHPLMVGLGELERRGRPVRTITLESLSLQDLGEMVAETFRTDAMRAEPLTALVHEKTGGNPFFTVQFLKELYDEGLVHFDGTELMWKWDIEGIRAKGYTDNVADLMAQKLKRLPDAALQEMKLAACIGNRFDLRTLSIISQLSEEQTRQALNGTEREGLLMHIGATYTFVHDRIQEAAYALVPEGDRPALHLRIGRLMLAELPEKEREERILDVVNQMNRGAALITGEREREQVAELNLTAAQRAKASTAYLSALHYARMAVSLIGADMWVKRPDVAFQLELLQAECEYLTGALESAKARLTKLFEREDVSLVDCAPVSSLLIDLCLTKGRGDWAVGAGLAYLKCAGVQWAPHPNAEEVDREFKRFRDTLSERAIEELMDLPLMEEPEHRAVTDVLAKMLPPALFTDEDLFYLVVCRMANLSLEHGNSDGSCLAYVWLGLLLGPKFKDYGTAYRFAKLGLELVEKRGLDRYKARVYLEYFHAATPWNLPLRDAPALAQRALDTGLQLGDLTFTAYSSCNLISALFAAGVTLPQVQEEAERRLIFCRMARFGSIAGIIGGQLGLVRQLRGLTSGFGSFDYEGFNQAGYERHMEVDPALAVVRSWYWIRKLEGSFFAGDFDTAQLAAQKMKEVLWTMPSHLEMVEYHFFAALTCCARYSGEAPAEERSALRAEVRGHLEEFKLWEEYRPDNFADRAALVGAELARIEGRELEAELLYEKALRLAREQGLIYHEALAYELASRFYRSSGFESFADIYLCHAATCYRRWGADGKVRQLEQQFPALKQRVARGAVGDVDAITMVKASQAISQEILLSNLLNTLMRIVLENAGARKGVLVLADEEKLSAEAEASLEKDQIDVVLRPPAPLPEILPLSVANFVKRTRDKVILDNAADPNMFSADDYLASRKPVSLLCLPVLRQSELVGLLYLENDLVKGAFTAARVAILEALAAQAAISLENARLYGAFRDLSENLEHRVKEAIEELAQKNRVLVLQSRQAIMGEMLGNIAHQWRQPLNNLALLAQELQMNERFGTLTKELLEGNVRKTMEIIQHMSKTIDDFRYFFRPEKEKVEFRLLGVLEKALSLLEGTFQAFDIKVETVAEGDPVLLGYPNEYSQVLLNLLNNAKDAFVSRKTAEPRVVITVRTERGRSVVTVADNAGGIDEAIIDKIFDLYFTTKGPEQGTGVGLFMCKNIIEKNMHGSLTVRNTGTGALFRIEV